MGVAQFQNCRSALRRRGCGCLHRSNSNCCRKQRSSATGSALSLESGRKGSNWKANDPCLYPNGVIWCAISGRGRGFFALPVPNIDGSCLFGLTLDFLRYYRTLLYGFCLRYH
jgi:hypothetical protein